MKDSIRSKYIRKQMKLSLWQRRFLLAFAVVVAALTTYALMTPAITLESEYLCGKEAHVHVPGCYVADPETGELTLICDKEEHVHDERCIVHDKNPERYICGHDYEHTHGEGCYRNGELICTLVEHTHVEDCLSLDYLSNASAGTVPDNGNMDEEALSVLAAIIADQPDAEKEGADSSEEDGAEQAKSTDADDLYRDDSENAVKRSLSEDETWKGATEDEAKKSASEDEAKKGESGDEAKKSESEDEAKKGATEDEAKKGESTDGEAKDSAGVTKGIETGGLRAMELDLLTLPDSLRPNITFTIYKGSEPDYDYYNSIENKNEIDTTMVSGSGYKFSLNMPPYSSALPNGVTYYYDLDCGGARLYMTRSGSPVPIEEYFATDQNIGESTMLRVVRNTDGTYRFYIHNDGALIRYFNVQGTLGGATDPVKLSVGKKAEWDASKLAYKYTITTTIPRAVDDFSQYYYLTDTTTISEVNAKAAKSEEYFGIGKNADNGTLVVKVGGNKIPSLSAAGSGDDFAYYVDPATGNLYIFNRFDSISHTNHLVSVPGISDLGLSKGFCLCWQQLQNLELTVTYDDIYGRPYVLNNEYTNTVQIVDQDGKKGIGGDKGENRNNLLVKDYSGSENAFTITFNSEDNPNHEVGDLGTSTDLVIKDNMSNATIKDSEDPVVYRDNMTDANRLTVDSDYTITIPESRDQFTITIPQPGKHTYYVYYKVQQDADATDKTITNTAAVSFAGDEAFAVRRETKPEFDSNSSGGSGGSIFYYVRLRKEYEENNPLKGASFGLYRADTDTLVKESVITTDGTSYKREVKEHVYGIFPDANPVVYTPGDSVDIVTFDANFLSLNTVYYIVETEAPENYELSTKRYYFYVTQDTDPVAIPDGPYDKSIVKVLNRWTNTPDGPRLDETFTETLVNTKFKYSFPETGSSAGLLLRTTGVVLMLSPALLLLNRKRNKKQATPPTQPELH